MRMILVLLAMSLLMACGSAPTTVAGATGAQGPQGAQGDPGAAGADGAVGPRGPAGTNGSNGSNGTNGTNGATGPTGASGMAIASQNTCEFMGGSGAGSYVYNYQITKFTDGSQYIVCNQNNTASNSQFVTSAEAATVNGQCVLGDSQVLQTDPTFFTGNGSGGIEIYNYPSGTQTTITASMTCKDTTSTALGYNF